MSIRNTRAKRWTIVLSAALAVTACKTVPADQAFGAPAPQTEKTPRSVILFVGDGMGISTVTAARIYEGQIGGDPGEEHFLSFERFPAVALVKTYNSNQQVPDSAGTASAMNTGVKTRAGVIGIGPDAHRGSCAEGLAYTLPNAAEYFFAAGKPVGIVTTTRITHATPAAVYGHLPERDWEADSDIPKEERAAGCRDLAAQLVDFPFAVALGGGRDKFFGASGGGTRIDPSVSLPDSWVSKTGGHYVTTSSAMMSAPMDGKPLFGLFSKSHMTYMLDRESDSSEPTLSQMTASAIERLEDIAKGYFLMVEGGRIDHGHHEGKAVYALSETVEFAKAVQVALEKVDLSETLILVTADHSHVFTIAGYPTRGNPILGLAMGNDGRGEATGRPILAIDGLPYTTLGYQNGPGAMIGEARSAPSTELDEPQQALVPTGNTFNGMHNLSETHGGEDVAVYATGAGSNSVGGVMEQNEIFPLICKALESCE